MGGVALDLAADQEPSLWLPALLTALFAALAWVSRSRPVALGVWLGLAALLAGFLSMSLRTARVAAPVLDHIRIVTLQGFVEEVDLRTVGARMVIGVASADGMPREKVPRRVRVTIRKAPDVAAGDYVALKARLLPPSRASLQRIRLCPRRVFRRRRRGRLRAGTDQAPSRAKRRELEPALHGGDRSGAQPACATGQRDHRRRRRRDRGGDGDGKRDFLSADAKDLIREAGIFHIITISASK